MLSQQYLQSIIKYCPDTGQFWWAVDRKGPRKAGDIAGGDHSVGSNTYREIRIDGVLYLGHRLAWLYTYGCFPCGEKEIDHIDGDGTNNRLSNLREVTSSENKQNLSLRSDNTSGVVGVNWHRAAKKWMASIGFQGRNVHLGLFEDFYDAFVARRQAESVLGFHENHGKRLKASR